MVKPSAKADAWDGNILEGQLTHPNGSDDLYYRSTETTPTAALDCVPPNTSIWEFLAWQPQPLP